PADLIRRSADNNNLFILAAGPVPPNPAELLSSQVFSDLLSRFSKDFDLVIVDSPPSMLVTDAAIISVKMDAVLVVLRSCGPSNGCNGKVSILVGSFSMR